MRMQYLDGTSGDDYLFDQPEDLHRVYVAGCMGYSYDAPESWERQVSFSFRHQQIISADMGSINSAQSYFSVFFRLRMASN